MRPESRIDRILSKLARVWHQPEHIDLRLGQLLFALNGGVDDLFVVEDAAWEHRLDAEIAGFEKEGTK